MPDFSKHQKGLQAILQRDSEIVNEICKDCAYRYTCQDAVLYQIELEELGCEYKGVMLPPESGK